LKHVQALTRFDERELEDLLADPDLIDQANVAPDVPETPVTRPGDLWLCGSGRNQHRILCADSTGFRIATGRHSDVDPGD
jgi:hypothetical protein